MTCAQEGCERPVRTRGWCDTHYVRAKRRGEIQLLAPRTPIERFWQFVEKRDDGCWEWVGARDKLGYGSFGVGGGGKSTQAHRWSYEHFVGLIPEGMTIDHLCFFPSCVNPEHLQVLSRSENARRQRSALAVFSRDVVVTREVEGHLARSVDDRGDDGL